MPPLELTPELLLSAYARGYFPMAMSRHHTEIEWFYPQQRGVLPLDTFHIPKSLAKFARKNPFVITTNQAFERVIEACAKRNETWINEVIIKTYGQLWKMGHAHSVECWQKGVLVGGLYGVSLGGAFFGESMFTRVSGASKIALIHLVQLLKASGYELLDTQFINDHLQQFGVIEIPCDEYSALLEAAMLVTPKECF